MTGLQCDAPGRKYDALKKMDQLYERCDPRLCMSIHWIRSLHCKIVLLCSAIDLRNYARIKRTFGC